MEDPGQLGSGQLRSVTFKETYGQRGSLRGIGVSFTTLGVLALVAAGVLGKGIIGLVLGGVALVLVGVWCFFARDPETSIDAAGIHAVSRFRTRSIRWSEIRDIDIKHRSADGDYSRRVRIRPKQGWAFCLTVPYESSEKGRQNPEFYLQYATIRNHWGVAIPAATTPGDLG
jgi:hypothetical protein